MLHPLAVVCRSAGCTMEQKQKGSRASLESFSSHRENDFKRRCLQETNTYKHTQKRTPRCKLNGGRRREIPKPERTRNNSSFHTKNKYNHLKQGGTLCSTCSGDFLRKMVLKVQIFSFHSNVHIDDAFTSEMRTCCSPLHQSR